MPKPTKNTKAVTVTTPKGEVTLFTNDKAILNLSSLPEGVHEATPQQIRFETPGQHIAGQYCGHTAMDSSFKAQGVFHFHEIKLSNGVQVGFIGSSQIDRTLCKLEPYKYDVHVIFTEIRDLSEGKAFKCFKIYVKEHQNTDKDKNPDKTDKEPF